MLLDKIFLKKAHIYFCLQIYDYIFGKISKMAMWENIYNLVKLSVVIFYFYFFCQYV